MPRKLPWKRQDGGSSTATRTSATATPIRQQKLKRDDSDEDEKKLPVSAVSTKRVKRSHSASPAPKRPPRPGSTSPPPEPLSESFMIEGLDHDDRFRMVEDEFLATAQLFTAHLHAAEYHRLKAASKSDNASTIQNISRPVVGRMTDTVKCKQDRKSLIKKQKAATRKAIVNSGQSDDDTESDDSGQSTSLYGLMKSPRKQAARLENLTKAVTMTRAAAGFSTAKSGSVIATPRAISINLSGSKHIAKPTMKDASETEYDDDDNLDTPPVRIQANANRKLPLSTPQPPKPRQVPLIAKSSPSLRYSEKRTTSPVHRAESRTTKESIPRDDSSEDLLSKLKRRQEERQRNREQRKLAASKAQSKEATNDIIPGFL